MKFKMKNLKFFNIYGIYPHLSPHDEFDNPWDYIYFTVQNEEIDDNWNYIGPELSSIEEYLYTKAATITPPVIPQ